MLYIERSDIFGPERLMLAQLAAPGVAEEVMDTILAWQSIQPR